MTVVPPRYINFNPFDMDSPVPTHKALDVTSDASRNVFDHMNSPVSLHRPSQAPLRKRQQESTGTQLATPKWHYNSVLNIFHHDHGCHVCDLYTEHVRLATTNDESFSLAKLACDNAQQKHFLDGIAYGRLQHKDETLGLCQEIQLLSANSKNVIGAYNQCKSNYDRVQIELEQVKQELSASRGERESLRRQLAFSEHILLERSSPAFSDSTRQSSSIASIPHVPQLCPDQNTKTDSFMETAWPPLFTSKGLSQSPHLSGTIEKETPSSQLSIPPRSALSKPSASPTNSYASVASSPGRAIPKDSSNIPPRSQQTHLHPSVHTSNLLSAPPRSSRGFTSPVNISEIMTLIAQARRPNNRIALYKIKQLCKDAHATSPSSRTPAQQYLLSNWRYCGAPNPRINDSVEVWFKYLCSNPQSWPRGVRKDPETGNPNMSDLKASRNVARTRPESGSLRSEFTACVTDLFSVKGRYRQLQQALDLTVSSTVTHKPFPSESLITQENVARHFADCGFTADIAETEFEPWAKAHKETSTAAPLFS